MEKEFLLTIFTPTYNRAKCLPLLYESLFKQTIKCFEWLIVDDGSVDNTIDVVQKLQSLEKVFPIRYFRKENGGKHTAINEGLKWAKGELFFIVDSDDVITSDAVETILYDWKIICNKDLCGISYLKGNLDNKKRIGDPYPQDGFIDSFINVRYNSKIDGDKAEIWVTDCMRENLFPEFNGERFISESVMWIKMAKQRDMFFRNKIVYLADYLPGGLSLLGRKLRFRCPEGMIYGSLETMSKEFSLIIRIKETLLYVVYGKFGKRSFSQMIKCPYKTMVALCWLPGVLLYYYWKRKYQM